MIGTRSPTPQARPRRLRWQERQRAKHGAGLGRALSQHVPVQRKTPWARSRRVACHSRPDAQYGLLARTNG